MYTYFESTCPVLNTYTYIRVPIETNIHSCKIFYEMNRYCIFKKIKVNILSDLYFLKI